MNTNISKFEGCIGIDLGTTYSCVGYWDKDNVKIIANDQTGSNTTPSWVGFTENEILVGQSAKNQASNNSKNTLFDIKRIIGKRYSELEENDELDEYPFDIVNNINNRPTIKVNYRNKEESYQPEQISALVLSKMKQIAEKHIGKQVDRAVITVPAYFNDSQRNATKTAATIAGLQCLSIINEPTAACLCYGLDKRNDNTKVLIFDLGGGTFDVSVLKLDSGIFEVQATCGDTHLGGEDFDYELVKYIVSQFMKKHPDLDPRNSQRSMRRIKSAAENIKKMLSTSQSAAIELESICGGVDFFSKISRTKFEQLCQQLFMKCLQPVQQVLTDSQLIPSDIDEIVLVGGSTRIPKIREILSEYFGGKQLNMTVHPDEAVAYGAAVQGAICSKHDESGKTQDLLLMDVTPLSLGIRAKGGVMSKIIDRNSQIPVKKNKMYSTSEDSQTTVLVEVFEGEREFTSDNHKIADFQLVGLPKQARGTPKIQVTFEIDGDGILTVKALDRETSVYNEVVISDTSRLTQEEINQMVEDGERFRIEDHMRREALNARSIYESYLADIQRAVTNTELLIDDNGDYILSHDDINFVNKCILVQFQWLEENEHVNKQQIELVKQEFDKAVSMQLNKLFARKKQVDMKTKYIKDTNDDKNMKKVEKYANSMFAQNDGIGFQKSNDDSDSDDGITMEQAAKQAEEHRKQHNHKLKSDNIVINNSNTKPKPKIQIKLGSKKHENSRIKPKPKIKVCIKKPERS